MILVICLGINFFHLGISSWRKCEDFLLLARERMHNAVISTWASGEVHIRYLDQTLGAHQLQAPPAL